ncbi:MAG: histidine kinase [Acidobacteria bacterium]|nr:histidine kinase [Acidobacteriota bacterium]
MATFLGLHLVSSDSCHTLFRQTLSLRGWPLEIEPSGPHRGEFRDRVRPTRVRRLCSATARLFKAISTRHFWETYKIFLLVNLHFGGRDLLGSAEDLPGDQVLPQVPRTKSAPRSSKRACAQSCFVGAQMQLHPHFLFNTLNAVSELIHKDRTPPSG